MSLEWNDVVLKDVLSEKGYIRGPFGSALKRAEMKSEGIPVYEQQNAIYDNRIFRYFIDEEKYQSLKRFTTYPDDLIISCSGTVGKVSIIKHDDPKGIISQALLTLRVNKDLILPEFLKYFFSSYEGYNSLVSRSTGSVQVNISKRAVIEEIPLKLPPLDVQQKIVYYLSLIDKKIGINEKINKNLQELAKSIYRYHFIDFEPYSQGNFISTTLGEIPENWSVQLIEEFVDDMKNGGTPKRGEPDYWDNGTIPWLKTGEINNNIIIKSEEHITELGLKNSSAKLLPINSIIMALYGKGTAARIGLLKHEATTNQACCAMICNDFNKTLFLYLFLLFNQKEIENLASGSVQQNLSKDIIANLELVVPPIEIIEKLPFKEIYDKISNNYFEIEYLTNLRDTLLPKLMSGEIDVSKINCDLE
ncbi:restriction endonuclease subunit S [uncultured Methanobrevibacter sp.]|uniref:restriction endonuclease subunit S n=1 Tax=uncultured Methanobrevibacter sp. TaxID=253161 RepID=UPI0025F33267|nr:restriction endonuclease subunit S [uncultured Methanobrevibacter sp.]